jgi:hypothetical protein
MIALLCEANTRAAEARAAGFAALPGPHVRDILSRCFRSDHGIAHFATIRSYLSTLRKQSANIFKSLFLTFQGSPPMPRPVPE